MPSHHSFARQLRLQRLHHHDEERLLVVPLDHSVTDGPIASGAASTCWWGGWPPTALTPW